MRSDPAPFYGQSLPALLQVKVCQEKKIILLQENFAILFTDDLLAINDNVEFEKFERWFKYIYPSELELKNEHEKNCQRLHNIKKS